MKEDPVNKNIIYVGTDNGLYVSINNGKSFMTFNGGLPRVAVHDIAIQERENEIVIGTHGRSIYKTGLDEIQKLDSVMNSDLFIYKPAKIDYDENQGKFFTVFDPVNENNYDFAYFVKTPGITNITIASENGTILKEFTDTSEAGVNYIKYDLSFEERNKPAYEKYLDDLPVTGTRKVANIKPADNGKYYLQPGKFILKLSAASGSKQTNFEVVKKEE
ncbi:MAG: WD40/YVTN/BNR-like repeat-containing protein [Chitinophagales bacterium]